MLREGWDGWGVGAGWGAVGLFQINKKYQFNHILFNQWPKRNNQLSATLPSSSPDLELKSMPIPSTPSSRLPESTFPPPSSVLSPNPLREETSPSSSAPSEADPLPLPPPPLLPLPARLTSPPRRRRLLRPWLPLPLPPRRRKRTWIWADSLIEQHTLFNSTAHPQSLPINSPQNHPTCCRLQSCHPLWDGWSGDCYFIGRVRILFGMATFQEFAGHPDEMLNYFSSYLQDMSGMLAQVKAMVYSLINITHPAPRNCTVSPDIHSIMAACKRTYDDLKRTESILRGHTKGKGAAEVTASKASPGTKKYETSGSRVSGGRMRNLEISKIKDALQPEASGNVESSFRVSRQANASGVEEESKSSRVTHDPIPSQICEDKSGEQNVVNVHSYRSASFANDKGSQDRNKQKEIDSKIESLRQSRKRDLKEFVVGNEECLSLIKRIRDELKIKKK